jgi:hypothetical protein
MALRLYSEFHSSTDKLFKVEIHDADFTGEAEAFTVASDGFTLNYNGETDDIVSPIIGSNCTISAYNNSSAFDSFISALKNYQEKRFTVRIYGEADTIEDGLVFDFYETELPPDNGLRLYWCGIVMQDLVSVEDTHKPYVFQITAVDGIGHLANLDYTWATYDTIESFLERATDAIGLDSLYADDDLLYATCLNTWDTNITYDANTDVATLIRYHAPILHTRESDGTLVYPKYLEVLQELCIAFGARFYQREGVYYFEQYIERTETTRTVSAYYKDGTKAFTSSVSDDITLDGTTSGGARLAGNSFNFLPALKKVEVRHNKAIRENLLGRFVNFYTTTTPLSLGVLSDDNNAYLQLNGTLNYRLTHPTTGSNTGYFRARFRIELKIEDQANPGTYYYLKRDWNPSGGQLYGATTWTTTASYYYLDATLAKNSATGLNVSSLFAVATPNLPVEGEATIDIEQNGLYNQNNNSVSVPSGYFAGWSVEDVLVTYKSDEANSVSTRYFSSNGSTNINSNLVLDLGEVRLADAFGGPGSFLVYDGSAWVASSDWRRGNSGGYENLLSLLTKEVLSLHSKPIERYSGTVVGAYPFGVRYSFEGSYWLPMQGSYNANMDEWSAEWFKVQKDDSNVTIDTPIDEGGLGDFSGRVSSSQGTDEFINGVQVTTTTSEVTGNATVGGTLGVTGASTLATTSVGEFTTTDRVNVTLNEITGNPGGSETITARDHFNFITYSGANGAYTINLPAAENGVIMRFKTDDTISNSKSITLQPQSGERIDAEATYSMDRAYDGITLLGKDSNWFIIQKKEK